MLRSSQCQLQFIFSRKGCSIICIFISSICSQLSGCCVRPENNMGQPISSGSALVLFLLCVCPLGSSWGLGCHFLILIVDSLVSSKCSPTRSRRWDYEAHLHPCWKNSGHETQSLDNLAPHISGIGQMNHGGASESSSMLCFRGSRGGFQAREWNVMTYITSVVCPSCFNWAFVDSYLCSGCCPHYSRLSLHMGYSYLESYWTWAPALFSFLMLSSVFYSSDVHASTDFWEGPCSPVSSSLILLSLVLDLTALESF